MNETDKLIEEQWKILPPNLQQAINAVPWKSLVNEIALLNKLGFEQIAIVERETMFIIYGFENPEDYIENIVREAMIDEVTATTIAEAVNDKIFEVIASKVEGVEKTEKPTAENRPVPEIPLTNLPMVEEGEVAHSVPHIEQLITTSTPPPIKPEPAKVSLPDYRYPDGKDPYREPLV